MDRLDALIAVAHLKLRLEILQRHPEMATTPVLPAPMEFAGLKSRLARVRGLEARAAVAGPRLDAALDVIETGVGVLETHAPELEKYGQDLLASINGMLAPSNGGPTLEAEAAPSVPPTPLNSLGGPRIHNSTEAAPPAPTPGA